MPMRPARLRTLRPKLREADLRAVRPTKRADPFYLSKEWRALMAALIAKRGRRCEARGCGRMDCRIFGHHVVELKDGGAQLDPRNIRLVCGSCHTKLTASARATRLHTD